MNMMKRICGLRCWSVQENQGGKNIVNEICCQNVSRLGQQMMLKGSLPLVTVVISSSFMIWWLRNSDGWICYESGRKIIWVERCRISSQEIVSCSVTLCRIRFWFKYVLERLCKQEKQSVSLEGRKWNKSKESNMSWHVSIIASVWINYDWARDALFLIIVNVRREWMFYFDYFRVEPCVTCFVVRFW